MKVKIVKGNGVKTVEEIRAEKNGNVEAQRA